MLFFLEHQSTNKFHTFYKAIENDVTDYGDCCQINVHLNFINPKTVAIDSDEYTAEDYLSVPPGSTNGVQGGLQIILDSEAFDYYHWTRGSSGFRLSLTDPRDKPIMNQDSFFIATGGILIS